MAKYKWDMVKNKLTLVENWAKDGIIDKDIATKLGISEDTFYEYKKKYPEFSEALKKGKEVVDYEVENALLKRALGYEYEEETYETVYDNNLDRYVEKLTKRVKKQVAPDTTAQIFWLKNRKPKEWREKQEIENNVNGSISITMDKKVEELSQ